MKGPHIYLGNVKLREDNWMIMISNNNRTRILIEFIEYGFESFITLSEWFNGFWVLYTKLNSVGTATKHH